MSTQDVAEFDSGLNWQKFCKAYAEYHGVKYSIAILEAGEAWKEYKELHGVPASKSSKASKQPPDNVVKRKDVPLGASGTRCKNKIGIKPPPKGYKAIITYVRDDESEEEEEVEEVEAPKKVKLPPAKKPVLVSAKPASRVAIKRSEAKPAPKPAPKKKAGLVKKKKEEVVIEEVEESDDAVEVEEEEDSEEEEESSEE